MKLDDHERQILALLQNDGRMPNVELAERLGMSESPCYRRVKQLEHSGVITRYAALLDQRRIGLEVTAFVQVTMEKQSDTETVSFHAAVHAEPSIIECHAMSGSNDYLLKVVARSIDHFSELIMQRILKFPGVMHVESNFSLLPIKQLQALPVY